MSTTTARWGARNTRTRLPVSLLGSGGLKLLVYVVGAAIGSSMFFRLFRAPDLAFWTIVVIGLGVLTGYAFSWGQSSESQTQEVGAAPAVRAPQHSAATGYVSDLETLIPSGTAAGTDPEALSDWAVLVQQYANEGMELRASEGAGESDPLLGLFSEIAGQAELLKTHADDLVYAGSLRTQIGLLTTQARSVISGLSVPGIPPASLDPMQRNDAAPDAPQPLPATPPAEPHNSEQGKKPQKPHGGTFPPLPDLSTLTEGN